MDVPAGFPPQPGEVFLGSGGGACNDKVGAGVIGVQLTFFLLEFEKETGNR